MTTRRLGRPRLDVDEDAITTAYANGATILGLATKHGVDRTVIRRVLREADGNVIQLRPNAFDVPPGHVTSHELLDRAGITYRQLDVWTRAGLLNPSNGNEPGTGRPRFYPTTELTVACLMAQLLRAGLNPRVAHRIARDLSETGTSDLAGIRIDLPIEP
jgi:hypothetical protein